MASKKDWKKTKVIYWKDENKDDFNEVGLKRPSVPEGYKYKRTNFFNNFVSAIFYHGIAKPVLGFYCLCKGIKVKGKKNLLSCSCCGNKVLMNKYGFCSSFL